MTEEVQKLCEEIEGCLGIIIFTTRGGLVVDYKINLPFSGKVEDVVRFHLNTWRYFSDLISVASTKDDQIESFSFCTSHGHFLMTAISPKKDLVLVIGLEKTAGPGFLNYLVNRIRKHFKKFFE